jgi:AraC-like DNA-binding protein/quercetin dioxygenase-like cupin family protein
VYQKIDIKNKLGEGFTFKISRFKEQIKKTNPHKHDEYYEMIFLSEGEGFHCIESERYMVEIPDFYFLKPGQLHFWQFTGIPKGYVILFKEAAFNPVRETDLLELLQKLLDIKRLQFKPGDYPEVILNEILKEFSDNSEYTKDIVHGLFKALLGKLLQFTENTRSYNIVPQSVFNKFRTLLIKECPRLHKVYEYAGLLNITPHTLNTVCKRQASKSASEMITSQVLLEAKRYILHTGNTISEIADILCFSDVSNFVKFFRKHEGITPVQFRDKYYQ